MRLQVSTKVGQLEVLAWTQTAIEVSLTGVRFPVGFQAVPLEEILLAIFAPVLRSLVVDLMCSETFVGSERFAAMLTREGLGCVRFLMPTKMPAVGERSGAYAATEFPSVKRMRLLVPSQGIHAFKCQGTVVFITCERPFVFVLKEVLFQDIAAAEGLAALTTVVIFDLQMRQQMNFHVASGI